MRSKTRIETGLFVLLDNPLLQQVIAGKTLEAQKQILAISQGGDNLVTFIKNFFIQFLYEGYGFVVSGFNSVMLLNLEQFFRRRAAGASKKGTRPETPNEMIEAINEYIAIDRDVMGGPYTREARPLKKLYCEFLPLLFRSFKADGKSVIGNYPEVMKKVDETLRAILKVCRAVRA